MPSGAPNWSPLSTQVRVRVYDPAGTLLVDSGSLDQIDVVDLTGCSGSHRRGSVRRRHQRRRDGPRRGKGDARSSEPDRGRALRRAGRRRVEFGPHDRSHADKWSARPLRTLLLSDGPAYGAAVVRTTLVAWLIAGCAALILAALGGVDLQPAPHPALLLAMAAASNGMADGDLAVRAQVDRADEIGIARGFLQRYGREEPGDGHRSPPVRRRCGARDRHSSDRLADRSRAGERQPGQGRAGAADRPGHGPGRPDPAPLGRAAPAFRPRDGVAQPNSNASISCPSSGRWPGLSRRERNRRVSASPSRSSPGSCR